MKQLSKILPWYILYSLLFCIPISAQNKSVNNTEANSCSNYLFEENINQWDNRVEFKITLNRGLSVFMEKGGFVYHFRNVDDLQALMGHNHQADNNQNPIPNNHHNEVVVRHHAVKVEFLESNSDISFLKEDPSISSSNYYLGNDPSKWATNVKSYNKITYKNLYTGVDMKLYCDEQNIKYDFIVAPNVSPNKIRLKYSGADKVYLSKGNLFVITSLGNVQELKPYAYQKTTRGYEEVPCNYHLENNVLSYEFPGDYNKNKPLIIDPVLIASTYTGSTSDNWGVTGTYDKNGNIYAGGTVAGNGYPTTIGAFQTTYNGGTAGMPGDIGLTVFTPDGANQIYATYFGGSNDDRGHSMYVNDNGELYILGITYSPNMPQAGAPYDNSYNNNGDIFIARFNPAGLLTAFTFLGGSGRDGENTKHNTGAQVAGLMHNYGDNARGEIVIDEAGNVIIATSTTSTNFPTAGAFQNTLAGNQDACVSKLSADLNTLIWSSYLGGSADDAGYALTIGENNSVYVVGGTKSNNFPTTAGALHPTSQGGTDGFVTRINEAGNTILASSYMGTSNYDQTFFVQTDNNNDIYLLGQTKGNYPVQAAPGKNVYENGGSSQFIHKLNPNLDNTIFSTVIGNGSLTPNISPTAFLVDTCGYIYLSGWGRCDNGSFGHASVGAGGVSGMPITADAFQNTTDNCDFYLMVLGKEAEDLRYGTFFGQRGVKDHVDGGTSRFDKRGIVYQSVCASCGGYPNGFPVTPGAYSSTNRSFNCNNAIFKLDFEQQLEAMAEVDANSGCAPHTVTFTNNSAGAKKYIWDFGDGTIGTTFNPTHTYTDPGTYIIQLIAIDSSSCLIADTTDITINVYGGDLEAKSDTNICTGLSVQLEAITSADSVRWTPNTGLNNATIKDPVATPPTTITYYVTAYKNSCISRDSVTVTIVNSPTSNFSGTTVCLGDSTNFTDLSAAGVTEWNWDFGDGTYSNLQNPSHLFLTPGTFDVKLKTSVGGACEDSISKSIVVIPNPLVDFTVDDVCLGTTLNLTNSSSGPISFWSWNFGDGNTSNNPNPTHIYASAGTYTVGLFASINGVCSNSLTKTVRVIPQLAAQFTANDVCEGTPVIFNDQSQPQNFITQRNWDFDDGNTSTEQNPIHQYQNPGTYNVKLKIEYNNGAISCPDSIYQQITVGESPKAKITADDACIGSEVQFVNGTDGPVTTTWKWLLGDGSTSEIKDPLHIYKLSGTFIVELKASVTSGNVTCSDSTSAAINIVPQPQANFEVEDICEGSPVQFRDLSVDPLFIKGWNWNFGDGVMSTKQSPLHQYQAAGEYPVSLRVYTQWGTTICSSTKTDTVSIFPKPTAAFSVDPTLGYAYEPVVKIKDLSTGGHSGTWDLGDGTTRPYKTIEELITHQYSSVSNNKIGPFEFPITLWLTSEHGCKDTAHNTVKFVTEWSFFVPNSFTPNGDGLNDSFQGKALGIIDYKMEIFNRWGELIFKTKDISETWDGTTLGNRKALKQDVYVWKVWLKNNLGETHKYLGHVTLLR